MYPSTLFPIFISKVTHVIWDMQLRMSCIYKSTVLALYRTHAQATHTNMLYVAVFFLQYFVVVFVHLIC